MSLVGKNVGNYVVRSKLGEGGMGTVYLGEHPLIGKRVAIKVLLEELSSKEDIVQRFFTEAKSVNDIGHQNIVDIIDFGKVRLDGSPVDTVYFIMEFLDGEALASRLRRTGLSLAETMHVMQQACSALSASHAKGIVHRDLKPDNIYLCPRGGDKNFCKVLDFGIAKLTGDGVGHSKTRTGTVIGTPAYMSPEQCEGKGQVDARSDVYSMGIVMYEMLTGRVPFIGEGFGEILVAHLMKLATPPSLVNPEIGPEIEAIVMHAIEKDRNARFQSMQEMMAALADAAGHYRSYRGRSSAAYATASFDETTKPGPNGPLATGNRPATTLSSAAGERGDAAASRGGKLPVFIGAAVLLAGLGVGAALWRRTPAPPVAAVQPVATGEAPKPVSKDVRITIRVTPPGATLFRADTAETLTAPATLTVPRGSSFDVQVKLAGWKMAVQPISAERDDTIDIKLDRAAASAQPVAVAAKPVRAKPAKPAGAKPAKPAVKPYDDDMAIIAPKQF